MVRFEIRNSSSLSAEEREELEIYAEEWEEVCYLWDNKKKEVVYVDGGEPEDMTLGRNLSVFLTLLNEVADGS